MVEPKAVPWPACSWEVLCIVLKIPSCLFQHFCKTYLIYLLQITPLCTRAGQGSCCVPQAGVSLQGWCESNTHSEEIQQATACNWGAKFLSWRDVGKTRLEKRRWAWRGRRALWGGVSSWHLTWPGRYGLCRGPPRCAMKGTKGRSCE